MPLPFSSTISESRAALTSISVQPTMPRLPIFQTTADIAAWLTANPSPDSLKVITSVAGELVAMSAYRLAPPTVLTCDHIKEVLSAEGELLYNFRDLSPIGFSICSNRSLSPPQLQVIFGWTRERLWAYAEHGNVSTASHSLPELTALGVLEHTGYPTPKSIFEPLYHGISKHRDPKQAGRAAACASLLLTRWIGLQPEHAEAIFWSVCHHPKVGHLSLRRLLLHPALPLPLLTRGLKMVPHDARFAKNFLRRAVETNDPELRGILIESGLSPLESLTGATSEEYIELLANRVRVGFASDDSMLRLRSPTPLEARRVLFRVACRSPNAALDFLTACATKEIVQALTREDLRPFTHNVHLDVRNRVQHVWRQLSAKYGLDPSAVESATS